ncbi:hypothetical protein F66182_8171 [Fusarium sp. NRRL 66182]|nr:hypothetical protein F66182_8171 [Fusarium sp. NRRL 66182]
MALSVGVIAILAVAGVLLLRCVFQLISSPLRTVPGPFLARFTDLWYLWKVSQGDFDALNRDLHKKHGKLVRYGPDRYSIDDPEAVKVVYGLGAHYPKSPWYSAWTTPGQWSLFGDQSVARSTQNRKLY